MFSPPALFVVLCCLGSLGIGCLLAVALTWRGVGRAVGDDWPKVTCKVVQLFALYGSTRVAFAVPERKAQWEAATIAGVACLVIWEVVALLIDSRVKVADRLDKGALARAEAELTGRTDLLAVFRNITSEKTKSLARVVRRLTKPPSEATIRTALTPEHLFEDWMYSLCQFFAARPDSIGAARPNFRAALYIGSDGAVTPHGQYDLSEPGTPEFGTDTSPSEAFRVYEESLPIVMACIRNRITVIVEDCFATEGPQSSAGSHRAYFRSLIAYPLGKVFVEINAASDAAILVESNWPGFFRETGRDSLEYSLREFAVRIKLDALLKVILRSRRAGS